ncbi:hypothetical protein CLU79DRAFT_782270 [Phycomyces nitens]|nr:hypothetical protein CLU79DRAFT_782270 [Phycomyces nitens]
MNNEEKADLVGLVNKTFKLYRSTPLCNYTTNRRKQKRLEKSLLQTLASRLWFDPGDQTGMDIPSMTNSNITTYKGLIQSVSYRQLLIPDWPSDGHREPIELKVELVSYDKNIQPVHQVIFFPPHREEPPVAEGLTSFPLLLVKATSGIGEMMVKWLESVHDCVISPFNVANKDLEAFINHWTLSLLNRPAPPEERVEVVGTRSNNPKPLELVYGLPGVFHLTSITITLEPSDLRHILRVALASRVTMMEAIKGHILHTMRLDIQALNLVRLGTHVAYLTNDGKLKVDQCRLDII